jgi:hemerythrin superfamily protein
MTEPTATPLDDFSHCHDGILSHLAAFGGLPALLDPAARARHVAADTVKFFRDVVYEHHQQEEAELFPAVLASAKAGAEREQVKDIVDRLTQEHRRVEERWTHLEPELKKVAKGQDASLDVAAVQSLIELYTAHARYEEQTFLPLSQSILGRNSNHMAALGLALHLRHSTPAALAKYGHRI